MEILYKNEAGNVITCTDVEDIKKGKPQYSNDERLMDGKFKAKVVAMIIERFGPLMGDFALNVRFGFEIEDGNGQRFYKSQPVFYPSDKGCDFSYIDPDRLAQLNILCEELCYCPEKRLGSSGTVSVKTETINGKIYQIVEEFRPDVELDDLI